MIFAASNYCNVEASDFMGREKKGKTIRQTYEVGDNYSEVFTYYDDDIIFVDNIKDIGSKSDFKTLTNIIIVCSDGNIDVEVNGRDMSLCRNELLICPPHTMLGYSSVSKDYECKVLCLTDRILQKLLGSYINVWNQALYVNKLNVRKMDERGARFYLKFYEILRMCIDEEDPTPYRRVILRSLLQAGMIGLCSMLERDMEGAVKPSRSQTESTFCRFLDLLNRDGMKRHTVMHYSRKLCITPKYLSMICGKHSGKTAKEWINDYLTEKVHYYLKSTEMPIKEIADVLGFPTPSSMGRYVKEHFGMSPLVYRNSSSVEN